jgi:hypothetical protein
VTADGISDRAVSFSPISDTVASDNLNDATARLSGSACSSTGCVAAAACSGKKNISVLGHALEHPCQAGTANALFTRKRDIDARVQQCLGNALVRGNVNAQPRAGRMDDESASRPRRATRSSEELVVHVRLVPSAIPGDRGQRIDEPAWTADINVRIRLRVLQHCTHVEATGIAVVVAMNHHAFGKRRLPQHIDESRPRAASNGVVQLERSA